jgi:hypothetical protein
MKNKSFAARNEKKLIFLSISEVFLSNKNSKYFSQQMEYLPLYPHGICFFFTLLFLLFSALHKKRIQSHTYSIEKSLERSTQSVICQHFNIKMQTSPHKQFMLLCEWSKVGVKAKKILKD